MLTPIMQSGIQGMQSSMQSMSRAAQQIAQANVNVPDVSADTNAALTGSNGRVIGSKDVMESLVELKYNVLLFQASAKLVTTSDTMIGSLLDVKA